MFKKTKMEDSFNASGKARERKRKAIGLAKKAAVASTPMGVPAMLADQARKGKISSQVREAWSGVDGFDNASGKKMTKTQKGALIGFTALILTAGLIWGIRRLSTRKA